MPWRRAEQQRGDELVAGAESGKRTVVELQILPNGDTLWNGQRIDEASLNKRFARVANESLPVEFRLKADQRADFEKVARVLSDAQRSGVTKIGFVNERPIVSQCQRRSGT